MDFDWSKLDRVEELMAAGPPEGPGQGSGAGMDAARALRVEITDLIARWKRTSDAQAEAVVTAAMLTTEIEETRKELRHEISVRTQAETTFQSLLRLTSAATGTSYFEKLSEGLAQALDPAFVLVNQTDGSCAQTLAVWAGGQIVDGFSYDLEGTPCAFVLDGVSCFHPAGVQALFPDDHLLEEMGVESYLGVPLRRPDGTVHGLIIVLDTRPREDLERATEIVELFADRASVELLRLETDRHLVEAKEAAEDASRSKSSFLAMISHEIRTPLNGILGMTSVLLLDPTLSAEHRGLIDTTHRSGQVLLRVLNDILDFSKIEAGELAIVDAIFDPEQVVEEVVALYDHGASSGAVACVAWAEANVPESAQGDETRIRQVLGNLVGNATKFTSEGEVRVVARCTADGEALEFEVRDTGIGIDPRAQSRIFEPFSQADGSMSRRFGGTGLGLSICRQLVEMMGGEIGVESELGMGSRFWFRVPLRPAGSARGEPHGLPLVISAAVAAPTTREALTARLDRLGVDTQVVPSLGELARMLDANAASGHDGRRRAIVVDLDLMTGAGDEAFRAVCERRNGSPLIALGSTADWWSTRLGRREFDGVLMEPMQKVQMEEVLRGLVPGHLEQEATPSANANDSGPSLNGRRVLLVEDNPVNSAVATRMLEKLGCEVEVAGNGREALERLEDRSFDAILMDCQMPVMDGFEATKFIREARTPGEPYAPIVAMTANAMEGDRERCLEAGMDDYLSKPVDLGTLREVLQQWVTARREAA